MSTGNTVLTNDVTAKKFLLTLLDKLGLKNVTITNYQVYPDVTFSFTLTLENGKSSRCSGDDSSEKCVRNLIETTVSFLNRK